MWNEPSKERLSSIPGLYQTEKVPLREKLIFLHFFIAGCDWYVAEYDGEDLFRHAERTFGIRTEPDLIPVAVDLER